MMLKYSSDGTMEFMSIEFKYLTSETEQDNRFPSSLDIQSYGESLNWRKCLKKFKCIENRFQSVHTCSKAAQKCALISIFSLSCAVNPPIIRGAGNFDTNMHLEVNKKLFKLSKACQQQTAAWLQIIMPSWQGKPHQRDHMLLTLKYCMFYKKEKEKKRSCCMTAGRDKTSHHNLML